jgi:hypothetical protein
MKQSAKKTDIIFIQIAGYRDPQLLLTLKSLIDNAKNPKSLRFGIAWQHHPDDTWDNLDEYKNDPRFKIIDIDYKDSEGVCWARNLVQNLYQGETYTLQIDSHTRSESDWDIKLLNLYKNLNNPKAIISTYPSIFIPSQSYEQYNKNFGYMLNNIFNLIHFN